MWRGSHIINIWADACIRHDWTNSFHRPHKLLTLVLYILAQDFIYPPNVGYPIGGAGGSQFAVIEMHYDNPRLMRGDSTACEWHKWTTLATAVSVNIFIILQECTTALGLCIPTLLQDRNLRQEY